MVRVSVGVGVGVGVRASSHRLHRRLVLPRHRHRLGRRCLLGRRNRRRHVRTAATAAARAAAAAAAVAAAGRDALAKCRHLLLELRDSLGTARLGRLGLLSRQRRRLLGQARRRLGRLFAPLRVAQRRARALQLYRILA